ncbi:MAG: hypothetical protein EU532_03285 [Promethearchaeota archaeon]|nr:MAG: hypothetical protein EU532_03285 [Candidatus Lokiarchaeota archaeon]
MSDKGEIPIEIEIFGVGTLEGIIIRHLGPISADIILSKMPFVLRGRFAFGSKNYWTLPIGIRKGPDSKATKNVDKGDIVYNPKTDEMTFILENVEMPNKVNKIGKIVSNIELFEKASNGLNTKISKIR